MTLAREAISAANSAWEFSLVCPQRSRTPLPFATSRRVPFVWTVKLMDLGLRGVSSCLGDRIRGVCGVFCGRTGAYDCQRPWSSAIRCVPRASAELVPSIHSPQGSNDDGYRSSTVVASGTVPFATPHEVEIGTIFTQVEPLQWRVVLAAGTTRRVRTTLGPCSNEFVVVDPTFCPPLAAARPGRP